MLIHREIGAGFPADRLPLVLADLHKSLTTNACLSCQIKPLYTSEWTSELAVDLIVGAGFKLLGSATDHQGTISLKMRRLHSLSDIVSIDMELLIVGLNPSPYSADHAIGYAHPANRFWSAAISAGIVSKDRDPLHALYHHGLGMTDLVRRVTKRADELSREELTTGFERVERLTTWLKPKALCFVGLSGWRSVISRRAVAGVQEFHIGDRPVYVMPHTSGLNGHCQLADLVKHFRAARKLADDSA